MSLAQFIKTSFIAYRFAPHTASAAGTNSVSRPSSGGWERKALRRNLPQSDLSAARRGAMLSRTSEVAEHGLFVVTLLVMGTLYVGAIALFAQLA